MLSIRLSRIGAFTFGLALLAPVAFAATGHAFDVTPSQGTIGTVITLQTAKGVDFGSKPKVGSPSNAARRSSSSSWTRPRPRPKSSPR